jgi:hypothetical protein
MVHGTASLQIVSLGFGVATQVPEGSWHVTEAWHCVGAGQTTTGPGWQTFVPGLQVSAPLQASPSVH